MSLHKLSMAAAVIAVAACRPYQNPLEPAPTELPVEAPGDAITEMEAGVRVTAAVDAWPGNPSVLDDVTPVRVTVRNESGRPLRLHLSDMRLVDATGDVYAALPLYDIDGRANVRRYAYRPTPEFYYDDYYLADPYVPYYGDVPVWDYGYPYDYGYYDYGGYYDYWAAVPLPTQRMVNLSIPEGVVADGGWVSGFVYFQRVSRESARTMFVYDLVDAETGEEFGEVDLAFIVVP